MSDVSKQTLWRERKVFSNADGKVIEEWQSAFCPFCNRYHTTPYTYFFDNYNYCPNCGHSMWGDKEAVAEEILKIPPAHPTISKTENVDGTISRHMAIRALEAMMPQQHTPDGSHPADAEIFKAQEMCADCIRTLEELPSVPTSWNMGHWICESKRSDTLGVTWNTWTCDQCNCVATKGWEHTESGMKPKGKFCSECGSIMSEKVIYVNITEKE